jgi:hypothetical protein
MSTTGHLWAIGFGDAGRADQVRDVIDNTQSLEASALAGNSIYEK